MAKEKRLIDADALMDSIKGYRLGKIPKGELEWKIENAPTVDAVELVRCKDCRWAREKDYREPTDTPKELICQCFKHHYIPAPWGSRMAVSHDDFCSYGERRGKDAID